MGIPERGSAFHFFVAFRSGRSRLARSGFDRALGQALQRCLRIDDQSRSGRAFGQAFEDAPPRWHLPLLAMSVLRGHSSFRNSMWPSEVMATVAIRCPRAGQRPRNPVRLHLAHRDCALVTGGGQQRTIGGKGQIEHFTLQPLGGSERPWAAGHHTHRCAAIGHAPNLLLPARKQRIAPSNVKARTWQSLSRKRGERRSLSFSVSIFSAARETSARAIEVLC